MRKTLVSLALLGSALAVAPTAQAEHGDTAVGAAIGAVSGAFLGHYSGGRDGAIVGGALGGAIGAAIGNDYGRDRVRYVDHRERYYDYDRRHYRGPSKIIIRDHHYYPPRYVDRRIIIRDRDHCYDGDWRRDHWRHGHHGWRGHDNWRHHRQHRWD